MILDYKEHCFSCFLNLYSFLAWIEINYHLYYDSHLIWGWQSHGEQIKSLLPKVLLINFPFWIWCYVQENKSGVGKIAQLLRMIAMPSVVWKWTLRTYPRTHITSIIKANNSSSKWSAALFSHLSMCLYTHTHTYQRNLLNISYICLTEKGFLSLYWSDSYSHRQYNISCKTIIGVSYVVHHLYSLQL